MYPCYSYPFRSVSIQGGIPVTRILSARAGEYPGWCPCYSYPFRSGGWVSRVVSLLLVSFPLGRVSIQGGIPVTRILSARWVSRVSIQGGIPVTRILSARAGEYPGWCPYSYPFRSGVSRVVSLLLVSFPLGRVSIQGGIPVTRILSARAGEYPGWYPCYSYPFRSVSIQGGIPVTRILSESVSIQGGIPVTRILSARVSIQGGIPGYSYPFRSVSIQGGIPVTRILSDRWVSRVVSLYPGWYPCYSYPFRSVSIQGGIPVTRILSARWVSRVVFLQCCRFCSGGGSFPLKVFRRGTPPGESAAPVGSDGLESSCWDGLVEERGLAGPTGRRGARVGRPYRRAGSAGWPALPAGGERGLAGPTGGRGARAGRPYRRAGSAGWRGTEGCSSGGGDYHVHTHMADGACIVPTRPTSTMYRVALLSTSWFSSRR